MHPPLYPFLDTRLWIGYGTKCLNWTEDEVEVARLLLKKRMIPVLRGPEVGPLLGVSARLVARASAVPERYYLHFDVLKRNGKKRAISAPRVYLKVIQRYLLDCILSQVRLPVNVVGFVRGRSMRSGALRHSGARYLWNIDLKDFFPSVSIKRVVAVFEGIGYPAAAALFMAKLCCLNGRLPQGAPTSPMLANLAFLDVDLKLIEAAGRAKIAYTRYADDLSFSSTSPIADSFRREAVDYIERAGFVINPEKTRLVGPACSREVTGLVINSGVSVPRKMRRKVRAIVHKYRLYAEESGNSLASVCGHIAHIANYHEAEARRYIKLIR